MKESLIFITFLLTLSFGFAAEVEQVDLKLSEVGLQLVLAPRDGQSGVEKISVTVTNTSSHSGAFRLPSPFVADDSSAPSFAPFPPWLGLLIRDAKSGNEEQFILTTFTKLRGPARTVFLPKGQSVTLDYRLTSFYRWGPCGPDRYGSFRDYFKPGEVEIKVHVAIFTESVEDRAVSNPLTVRRSFPEWLFKASGDSEAKTGEPDGNPGGDDTYSAVKSENAGDLHR